MLWLIALTVLAFYFAVLYTSQSFNHKKYEAGRTPSIFFVLLKILFRIMSRRQGEMYYAADDPRGHARKGEKCPTDNATDTQRITPGDNEVVIITNYRVSNDKVAQYNTVCGEDEGEQKVPLCFPESLFMHNLLLLVCKPSFKLSPLGLIHIGQTVKQHEDLQQLLDSACCLEARTVEYRLVPGRGVEVDVSVQIVAASQRCIWSGVATLLSRSPRVQNKGGATSSSRQQEEGSYWDSADRCTRRIPIEVAGDTGVRYAGVSMDWNPHHLYPWSARPLGYHAPIAHGLWTLAKAVALITATKRDNSDEDKCKFSKVECRFKRPLYLPGTATLEYYTDSGSAVRFRVIDSKTHAPHVVGSLS